MLIRDIWVRTMVEELDHCFMTPLYSPRSRLLLLQAVVSRLIDVPVACNKAEGLDPKFLTHLTSIPLRSCCLGPFPWPLPAAQ